MITTRHFSIDQLGDAAELLREGQLVAFPTETVFGLGANALDAAAVDRIFVAKGRPSDNPLIVHLASRDDLSKIVSHVPQVARALMDRFWPGPLTLVFEKSAIVPDSVTAGLDTVAVRVPAHPVAAELIRLSGVPIAAPSANRSGRPSATTWQAVSEDLEGRIAGIIEGAPTQFGLESTVVDVSTAQVTLLRPGGVSLEALQQVVPGIEVYDMRSNAAGSDQQQCSVEGMNQTVNSPGLRHRHYQPKARILLVKDMVSQLRTTAEPSAFIGVSEPADAPKFTRILVCQSVEEYASSLFDFFRQADQVGAKNVYCESVPEVGIGAALMDRLRRASES